MTNASISFAEAVSKDTAFLATPRTISSPVSASTLRSIFSSFSSSATAPVIVVSLVTVVVAVLFVLLVSGYLVDTINRQFFWPRFKDGSLIPLIEQFGPLSLNGDSVAYIRSFQEKRRREEKPSGVYYGRGLMGGLFLNRIIVTGRENVKKLTSHTITVKKSKRVFIAPIFNRLFGRALFSTYGEDWKRQHRIILRCMGSRHRVHFLPFVVSTVTRIVNEFSHSIQRLQDGEALDSNIARDSPLYQSIREGIKRKEDNTTVTLNYDPLTPQAQAAIAAGAVPITLKGFLGTLSLSVISRFTLGASNDHDTEYIRQRFDLCLGFNDRTSALLWLVGLDRIPGFLSLPFAYNIQRLKALQELQEYAEALIRRIKKRQKKEQEEAEDEEEEGEEGKGEEEAREDMKMKADSKTAKTITGEATENEGKKKNEKKKILQADPDSHGLAALMIRASDPQVGLLSEEEVVHNLFGFLIGGINTVSDQLKHVLVMLTLHPEVQTKVREEVEELMRGKTEADALTLDALDHHLPYLSAVVKETQRLHPGVPAIPERKAKEDFEIAGVSIKQGMDVIALPALEGTSVENWGPDALEFRPERFLEGKKIVDRGDASLGYKFIPFGAGVRPCIARHLALIELKVSTALIVKNLELFPLFSPEISTLKMFEAQSFGPRGMCVGMRPLLTTTTTVKKK